uniref:Protein NipSnap n=1 Tax=Echinostoma caproni TaxID=27848 RepID=A0A183ALV7_9TREM
LHHEQARRHRDAEERILVSAWYNLIGTFTRDAVEQRIQTHSQPHATHESSLVNRSNEYHPLGTATNEASSFLERQRELHLKPPRGLTSVVVASK